MENSAIEWTDHTFSPWIGCAKVSDGCKHCYAERLMDKRFGRVKWGAEGHRVRTSVKYWQQPLKWAQEARETGVRKKVFCASLADVFENKPDQRGEMDEWRYRLFHLMSLTPELDWLLLTKRPEYVEKMIVLAKTFDGDYYWDITRPTPIKLPDNVWIGTSVEDQATFDSRAPALVKISARIHFLSCEPLLGPINITGNNEGVLWPWAEARLEGHGINWVIAGGESGPEARSMHPTWVRMLRDQCVAASVPFHFKQWGEDVIEKHMMTTYTYAGRELGAKRGGRVLDGREWSEFPNV